MAPIKVGDKIPDGELTFLGPDNSPEHFSVHKSLKGKKAVLLGVPGAFTPVCSNKHVPSFMENAKEIKSKGVSEIIVISVNDPYVMKEWEKSYEGNEHLKFMADGSKNYTKALGLELDLSEKGLGVRSKRYALLVDDLIVKVANIETDGGFDVSSGENILKAL